MSARQRTVRIIRGALPALGAMALASVAALTALEIWRADLHAPFVYRDDSVLNLMAVKSVLEDPWYFENDRLGAPLGQELYDYPVFTGDHLNLLLFKLIGVGTGEPAAVLNVFFLLTFPLVSLTAFVVLRRFRISVGPATVCSALYALLPYHFLRGETHVLLSAYYAVPLAAYLILAVLTDEPLFARSSARTGVLAYASTRTLATVGVCLVVAMASGSFYYAAFAVVLLAAAAVLRSLASGRVDALVAGGLAATLILGFSALNAAPSLVYRLRHGGNDAIERQPFESEYYSLRLTQLLLPLETHRFEPFARVRRTYEAWSPSTGIDTTEAALATLGTTGALGLLGLFAVVLVSALRLGQRGPPALLRAAGVASVVALLIATMGGFSSFAGLVYPQLRSWNRLSIFIAFFALLAVAVALDGVRLLLSRRTRPRVPFAALLALVFALGALDQTSGRWVPAYEETAARYRSDRAFVRSIEEVLAGPASVFQLPYAAFPEYIPPPPGRTVVYDALRPYLHSERLRWSFGAMQRRPADWAAQLDDKPLDQVLRAVSAVGFSGVYVDRLGYDDDASADAVERQLVDLVARRPLRSDDGRFLFFDLRRYNARLRNEISARERARLRSRVLRDG